MNPSPTLQFGVLSCGLYFPRAKQRLICIKGTSWKLQLVVLYIISRMTAYTQSIVKARHSVIGTVIGVLYDLKRISYRLFLHLPKM